MSDADPATFDAYAGDYDAALEQGLSVSGEGKTYFARGRLRRLARLLDRLGARAPTVRVLDFGCGTGSSTPLFFETVPGVEQVVGVDVSAASIDIARRDHASERRARFERLADQPPDGSFDLAFCNGVFHHVPPAARASAVRYVFDSLRPGGLFSLWENNPWNPGTRYVMSRIPFDRDAILLWPGEARAMLRGAGFEVLRTDFLFIFPRVLRALRMFEAPLARFPLGAQYGVLARKPAGLKA